MASSRQLLVSATLAFAGGFCSGLLYAPQTGRELRRRIVRSMQQPSRWAEARLHEVETRLSALESQLHDTTDAFRERFHEVTGRTLEAYLPTFAEQGWDVKRGELLRELRFMPRR